ASMDAITAKSESINVALAPHRSKVEKLIGVRRLLKRLEFIFELPQRLNTYDLAPKRPETWVGADLLACFHVFSVYKTHFMPESVARGKTSRKSSEVVRDDLFLGFSKELFALYLDVCTTQFRRPLSDFGTTREVLELLQDDGDAMDSEYFAFMRVLKYFVAQVKDVDVIIPMCGLATTAVEIVEACVRFQIEGVFQNLRQETGDLFCSAHEDVTRLGRSSRSPTAGAGESSQSVQPLAQDAARKFTDMMQQVLRQMEPLVQTGASILSEISRLFSDLVQVRAAIVGTDQGWLFMSLISVSNASSCVCVCVSALQSQFYHFLKWFNAAVLLYAEPKRAFTQADASSVTQGDESDALVLPWLEPSPPFLLFLACMCRNLAAEGIGECVRELIECLPAPLSPSKVGEGGDASRSRHMSQLDVTHMIQVTRESSVELLQVVAKQYGNQLCLLIQNGVAATSWADIDEEPRSVQEMMAAVVEATFRFGKELALALGDEHSAFVGSNSRTASRDFRRRASALRSRNGGAVAASSGMQLDVARIFARKIQIFPTDLELTADAFVQAMLKMAIKAFSEWVRLLQLSKFALQQIQLNAEFLRSTLVHVVAAGEAEEEVESLLSDLLSNARARAVEDVLMEQSSVVAIVSTKSTQVLSRRG
ncbi:hypothetical protein BBJ28_00024860, partial [Nothophytophthora sp. Chile5]